MSEKPSIDPGVKALMDDAFTALEGGDRCLRNAERLVKVLSLGGTLEQVADRLLCALGPKEEVFQYLEAIHATNKLTIKRLALLVELQSREPNNQRTK